MTQLPSSIATVPPTDRAKVVRVLVVDDDVHIRKALSDILCSLGFDVWTAGNIAEAREILPSHLPDIVLLDLRLPGGCGLTMIEDIRALDQDTVVVVMTGNATIPSAVEAMRKGATEYLVKPFPIDELSCVLQRASQRRHFEAESRRVREKLRTKEGFGALIGHSPEMERIYRILAKVAHTMHPVLLMGENGTGKKVAARTIHLSGPNASCRFVSVDCGSLPPTISETEMMGSAISYSGECDPRETRLLVGGTETFFFDAIDEMPLELQVKLSRMLRERSDHGEPQTRARILAATSRNLAAMVEDGRFRKDLYSSLNLMNVRLPPLRERRQDVFLLASHFLERRRRETGVLYTLSDDVLRVLSDYDWPGNVRELEAAIERACSLSSGTVLHMFDMPSDIQEHFQNSRRFTEKAATDGARIAPSMMTIAEIEKLTILNTLEQLNGDKATAARLLGIGKTTLYRKLSEYSADVSDGRTLEP